MSRVHPLLRRGLPLLALAALFPRAARAQDGASPLTEAVATATFDSAWSTIDRTLWDSTVAAGTWAQIRGEYRERAQGSRTVGGVRRVLTQMIEHLPYSHFGIIPVEVQSRMAADPGAGSGDAGMEVRLVQGRVLVTRVDSGGGAFAAGVRPGWEVLQVERRRAAELLALVDEMPGASDPRTRQLRAWSAFTQALRGPLGQRRAVRFRDGRGREVSRALALAPPEGLTQKFGNLPEMAVRSETRRLVLDDGTRVGVFRFNYWMPVILGALNAGVDSLREVDGMVIDLRGNLGGVGAMAPGFAGHFVDRVDTLGVMRMRASTLYFVATPRTVDGQARPVRPFTGPLAVLTDAMSASTSELFAGGLQQLGRARVFGETSAGQALPALAVRLPDGDVLMHAIADFSGPRGQRFEGLGVTPDQPAPPTRAALLAGHDPAMEAALAWIRAQRQGTPR